MGWMLSHNLTGGNMLIIVIPRCPNLIGCASLSRAFSPQYPGALLLPLSGCNNLGINSYSLLATALTYYRIGLTCLLRYLGGYLNNLI